jgi:SAM-dependent methyltransferase
MSMNWRVKGLIQKFLGSVPGGVRVNDLLQRKVGGLRNFDHHLGVKVSDWCFLARHLASLGFSHDIRCMEIGTGWMPTLPICFVLAGATRCATFDLSRHLDERLTFRMLEGLASHLPAIAAASDVPLSRVEAVYQKLRAASSLDRLLRLAHIDYFAPADATRSGLPVGTIDLVFSNSVLEHVYPETIAEMMRESRRVLRDGGVSLHCVNCGDHYAYFDRKISAINYLTYSDRAWQFWNNKMLYQNRLRPREFLHMGREAGLTIVLDDHKPQPELLRSLSTLPIAPEFRQYSPEQLSCTSITFAGQKL